MTDEQLTIDGDVEPYAEVAQRNRIVSALSGTQREILRRVREEGGLRGVEAGVMIHAARNAERRFPVCGGGAKGHGPTRSGACCHYAATDGAEAMKRLQKRGLVKKKGKKWVMA